MGYSSVCLLSVGLSFNKKMSSKIYIYLLNSARTQLELGKLGFFLGQTRLELDSTKFCPFSELELGSNSRVLRFLLSTRLELGSGLKTWLVSPLNVI